MPCSGAPPPPRTERQLTFDDLLFSGPGRRKHRFRRGYVAWLLLQGASRREIQLRTGHDRDTITADCRAVAALLETMMKRRGYAVRDAFPDSEKTISAPRRRSLSINGGADEPPG